MKLYLLSMMTYSSGSVEDNTRIGAFSSVENAVAAAQMLATGITWIEEPSPDSRERPYWDEGCRETIEHMKDVYYGGEDIARLYKILVLKMWITPIEVDHYAIPR